MKRTSLKTKAVIGILLFTLILTSVIVALSYTRYTKSFQELYSSMATSVADSVASLVDPHEVETVRDNVMDIYSRLNEQSKAETNAGLNFDQFSDRDWAEYNAQFESITQMPEYLSLLETLTKVRQAHHVLSLYLGYSDLKTRKDIYLVDSSDPDEQCMPGHCDDIAEGEHLNQMLQGQYEFEPFITNSAEYGWLCTATVPILDETGAVISTALVDISMNKTMSESRAFLYALSAIAALISLLMILLVYHFVNKAILAPINQLNHATGQFVSSKKDGGEGNESEISKLAIKTGDEIESLSDSIKQMEQDLNTYISELTNITAEKERISAELDVATHIQSSMLPCIFPAFPEREEFDIHATMTPAKEVGGDFYDFFMVDNQHLAIVMADVSGKGVPAALFMVIAKTLIKDHTQPGEDLGRVFTQVNNLLCESNSEGLFVTAFEGVLDLVTGEFRFVNAGHEVPYIYKKAEGFQPYKVRPGFVLAGMEDMKYKSGILTLDVGDKLFQYTDGVTEATNAHDELYGDERLHKVLSANAEKTPVEILQAVKQDIDAFVGEASQFDDITMLCFEYKKKMPEPLASRSTEITVDATLENIETISSTVEQFLDENDCSIKAKMQIIIAIDEIIGNIVNYAYSPDIGQVTVRMDLDLETQQVALTFIDAGVPYDPMAQEDPDISLSAEEREIGGLGIFMVKKTMDEMRYAYQDGKNILTVRKTIS